MPSGERQRIRGALALACAALLAWVSGCAAGATFPTSDDGSGGGRADGGKFDDPSDPAGDGGTPAPSIDETLGPYPFLKTPGEFMAAAAAAPETWQWVEVPGAKCRSGSPASFVAQVSPRSKDLVIVLSGGGGCFTQEGCTTNVSNLDADRGRASDVWLAANVFERSPDRPFKDRSFVFVPYCTGDLHGGTRENVSEIACPRGDQACPTNQQFVGHRNMEKFLHILGRYFRDAERVTLTGFSAGAYGALLNYEQTRAAFPGVEVSLISDSGPTFTDAGFLTNCLDDRWRTLFGLDAALPKDCDACRGPGGLRALPAHHAKAHPSASFGLVSPTLDPLIYLFLASGNAPACALPPYQDFRAELRRHRDDLLDLGNWSTMAVPEISGDGSEGGHVYHHKLDLGANGVTVGQWMNQVTSGEAAE